MKSLTDKAIPELDGVTSRAMRLAALGRIDTADALRVGREIGRVKAVIIEIEKKDEEA